MARAELIPSGSNAETFADYSKRVLAEADEVGQQELKDKIDPAMAEVGITHLKFTLPKYVFDKSGNLKAKISFFYLGPSAPRTVRGVECTYAPDADGYQRAIRHEWDYMEPSTASRQRTIITYNNVLTGDSFTSGSINPFGETDLSSIEDIIQDYKRAADGEA